MDRRVDRRVDRWARVVAWLGMLALLVSCGAAQAAATTTPMDRSLDDIIAVRMEGVQLEVWGGGAPSPGRTTTLFAHHGDHAAMLYWNTDGWCLARVYSWSIEHVQSQSSFEVRYVTEQEFPDCLMHADGEAVLKVVAVDHLLGETRYTASWAGAAANWAVRTQCTNQWDASSPCGFDDVAGLLPSL